jgi:starch phosphorylase
LQQEIVLGMGGVRMAHALGHRVNVYHMNEGHAALLTLALLESQLGGGPLGAATEADIEQVRKKCVFTTHTPVPAGHDRFSTEQASRILGGDRTARLEKMGCFRDGMLNMTLLALRFSRYANGVAMQHAKVSRAMFPNSPSTRSPTAFTRPPGSPSPSSSCWMSTSPRGGATISICAMRHRPARGGDSRGPCPQQDALLVEVAKRAGSGQSGLDPKVLTLGFARRAATYKRATLLFHRSRAAARDCRQGRRLADYSSPARPIPRTTRQGADSAGRRGCGQYSNDLLRIVYLENYDWNLGALLTAGVDVWVNTPRRPYEASGTSGMKAALNGVPSLSILDGWWIEGCIEGVTGWAIEDGDDDAAEANSLYSKAGNCRGAALPGCKGEVGAG